MTPQVVLWNYCNVESLKDKETQIESIGSFTPGTGGVNAEMAGIAVQSSEDKELKSAIDNGLHCICEIDVGPPSKLDSSGRSS